VVTLRTGGIPEAGDECTASAAVAGSVVTSTSPSAATAAFTAQPRSATLITRDRNAREASR
jgi:hypothetical protein